MGGGLHFLARRFRSNLETWTVMSSVFGCMSSKKLAQLIRESTRRVVLCVPAVRTKVATALTETATRIGSRNVRLVMDCDEEVSRLGYGEIAASKALYDRGIDLRQCPGLRIGLLIVDDRGWAFTPTALYVQAEVHSDKNQRFPKAWELLQEMSLDVQFRDVTYETLNEKGFADALRKAFPHVNWDKPFQEYKAAKENMEGSRS